MGRFADDVVAAVLHHMNDDHTDDSLIIVRGHAEAGASSATMSDLDTDGGTWLVEVDGGEREIRIDWPIEVTERPHIRQAVVVLYDSARETLGMPPRD